MECPNCRAEVDPAAVYCSQCGTRIDTGAAPPPASEQTAPASVSSSGREQFKNATATRANDEQDIERPLWSGGYSGRAMAGTWIACAVGSLLAILAAAMFQASGTVWMIVLVAIALAWAFAGLTLLYRKLSIRYELTSQRLIHESGILKRVTDRIEVIDMDDITYEQGIVQRLFNVGTIRIDSSDRSHPQLLMHGIEDVKRVATLIDNARREERVRRGLHIEAV